MGFRKALRIALVAGEASSLRLTYPRAAIKVLARRKVRTRAMKQVKKLSAFTHTTPLAYTGIGRLSGLKIAPMPIGS